MADTNFDACLAIILQSEGGYSNNPADSGGPTNLGITLGTLTSWEGHQATISDVQALTPATVQPIYEANYWRAAGCDSCPAGVDLMVFDMAVNQGTGRAIRSLQAALNIPQDGVVGPITRGAAAKCNAVAVIKAINADRDARYRSYAAFAIFGAGWMNRLARTTAYAMHMAPAALDPPVIPPEPVLAQPAPPPPPVVVTPPAPPAPPTPQLAPAFTPSPVAPTPPTVATVATPARVGSGVALAGLTAGATAMAQVHIVDFKGLVNAAFIYLLTPVVLGVVAGLATSLAKLLNINMQSALAQRVLTAADNGALALMSKAQTAADTRAQVTTKNEMIAGALSYVNTAVPDAVKALGLATPAGQAHLTNLVEARVQSVISPSTPTPQVAL
jgi:lysozyme family protein